MNGRQKYINNKYYVLICLKKYPWAFLFWEFGAGMFGRIKASLTFCSQLLLYLN